MPYQGITTFGFIMLALAAICGVAAVVLLYRSRREAPIAAFVAMIIAKFGCPELMTVGSVLFWGAATAIVVALRMMLPEAVNLSRKGLSFLVTGALAGLMVGMLFRSGAALVIGPLVGVIFGALALGNTPAGRELDYPSRRFVSYILAKGFPVVVAMAVIGQIVPLIITALYK